MDKIDLSVVKNNLLATTAYKYLLTNITYITTTCLK